MAQNLAVEGELEIGPALFDLSLAIVEFELSRRQPLAGKSRAKMLFSGRRRFWVGFVIQDTPFPG